jgi:hypothetical protein
MSGKEDLVQVTLECPDLDFPIRLPFIQMNQLTSELLLTEMERVLQSNEQFVLDHCVQLNITSQIGSVGFSICLVHCGGLIQ